MLALDFTSAKQLHASFNLCFVGLWVDIVQDAVFSYRNFLSRSLRTRLAGRGTRQQRSALSGIVARQLYRPQFFLCMSFNENNRSK
jgi:hypothetical protein